MTNRGGSKLGKLLESDGERLYRLLVRLTLREDAAEDLLQDLVVKLSGASGFVIAENPYAYARRAAINLAFSWIRSRRRDRHQPVEEMDLRSDTPPPWLRLVDAEDIRRVLSYVEEMGDQDRLIVAMRYFEDAGYAEIAQVIGRTADQARALCHKAIRQLRAAMLEEASATRAARAEVKP